MTPAEIIEKLLKNPELRAAFQEAMKKRGLAPLAWSPVDNIADAWDVVEVMRKRGWHVVVNAGSAGVKVREDWPAEYHAAFTPGGILSSGSTDIHHGFGDSFPAAICRAAISALATGAPRAPGLRDWRGDPGGTLGGS